jgi:hypothetical protein
MAALGLRKTSGKCASLADDPAENLGLDPRAGRLRVLHLDVDPVRDRNVNLSQLVPGSQLLVGCVGLYLLGGPATSPR